MAGHNSNNPGRNRPPTQGRQQGVQRSYASEYREHEPLFNTYEHLQNLPRPDTALTMLRKIASLVKPLMRKRNWKVQVLAEFLPPEANLLGLNINRGYKICVRLRYHNHPDLFLPVEQVVDTMLHELSHNVWGAHDANFHRLWDELRAEHDILVSKGYTGEGFLSEGQRLGGGGGGGYMPPPQHEMRRLARQNAEKRRAQNKLTKGSGQRLGGTPLHLMGGDVRKVIVDQVKNRNTINTGCGSGRNDAVKLSDQSAGQSFRTKAEEDDANDRAITQALYELIEEEEERKLRGDLAAEPPGGGLAWHPQNGLYNPQTEASRLPDGASEDEQMQWAMQESMRAGGSLGMELGSRAALDSRVNSAPPASARYPPHTNPLSAFAPPSAANGSDRSHSSAFAREARTSRSIPPLSNHQRNPSSSSQSTSRPSSSQTQQRQQPPQRRKRQSDDNHNDDGNDNEPLIDLSDPFDPLLASRAANGTLPANQHLPIPRPARGTGITRASTVAAMSRSPASSISSPLSSSAAAGGSSAAPKQWTCTACTFINPSRYLACDVCGTESTFQELGFGSSVHSQPASASASTLRSGPAGLASPTNSNVGLGLSGVSPIANTSAARGFSGRSNGYASDAGGLRRSQTSSSPSLGPARGQPSTGSSHARSGGGLGGGGTTAPAVSSASQSSSSLGWVCKGCGAFMEHRWWTCSGCGRMKESS